MVAMIGIDRLAQMASVTCATPGLACGLDGRACAAADPAGALRRYAALLARSKASGDWLTFAEVSLSLTLFQVSCGRLQDAAIALEDNNATLAQATGAAPQLADLTRIGAAALHYERGELAAASELLARSLSSIEAGGYELCRSYAAAELACVAAAQGGIVGARAALHQLTRAIQHMNSSADQPPLCVHFLQLRQVEAWLLLGDTAAAARWAVRARITLDAPATLIDLLRQYALAQILVGCWPCTEMLAALLTQAHTGPLALAQRLLARCAATFAAQGYEGLLLDTLTLQAVAYSLQGDSQAALASLTDALALGAAEGHVRQFANRGRIMADLLMLVAGVRPQADPLRAYALRLLAAFPPAATTPVADEDGPVIPIETLSSRELDVLHLIAQGQTSREIAASLSIAFHTVRTHSKNIYGKLTARNRVEAVERARALRIL